MISDSARRALYAVIILLLLALATLFILQWRGVGIFQNKNIAGGNGNAQQMNKNANVPKMNANQNANVGQPQGSSTLPSTVPGSTDINPPPPVNQAAINSILLACEQQGRDVQNLFPNTHDYGTNDTNPNVPKDYIHVLSIPQYVSKNVLRVYFNPTCEEIRLTMYHPDTKTSVFIGAIAQKTGSNAGGISVPFAFTKDDANILLDAWMGTPGAGGGNTDYGYSEIPVKAGDPKNPTLTPTFVATRRASFYDSYGKVVYTDSGSNTPSAGSPGPSNNAVVVSRNLATGLKKTLLKEKDVSYQILDVDEAKKELRLAVTSYAFTQACPRTDGNLYCANKEVSNLTIALP